MTEDFIPGKTTAQAESRRMGSALEVPLVDHLDYVGLLRTVGVSPSDCEDIRLRAYKITATGNRSERRRLVDSTVRGLEGVTSPDYKIPPPLAPAPQKLNKPR